MHCLERQCIFSFRFKPCSNQVIYGEKIMEKSRKKSAALFAGIFVFLGMWMILSLHCWAAETNNDEKLPERCSDLISRR